jgi:hypothetical protein
LIVSLFVILIAGVRALSAVPNGLKDGDRKELLGYARDTWKSVAEMADGSKLPIDGLRHQPDGTWKPSRKTTPTNIGAYVWSVLAAERLSIIGADEAQQRLARTLEFLGRVERVHGFFYDKIDPWTGVPLKI